MSNEFYRSFEERFRGSRALIKSRLEVYLPFIRPLRGYYKFAPVVDVGCGRGEWLELMKENGFDAQGIDLDDGMLSACRELGLSVHTGDALEFLRRLPDGSQVVVSGFHIAEHLPFASLQALVDESFRVLMPGGLLILETPNPENLVVGSSSFYLDPTHQRPIPPQMLAFLADFSGFNRSKILRLQGDPRLLGVAHITLLDVLTGVSPDCALVAQKEGPDELLSRLNPYFDAEYGLTLANLAKKYQQRMEALSVRAEVRAIEAETRATKAEARIEDLINSTSWRITSPLRFFGTLARGIFPVECKRSLRSLLSKVASYASRYPLFKRVILGVLLCMPGIKWRVIRFLKGCTEELDLSFPNVPIDLAPVSSRPRFIYVDVSGLVRTDLRTGIQRVIRGLLLAMFDSPPEGYLIKPVFALPRQQGYCHAEQFRRQFLNLEDDGVPDLPIVPEVGDLFLGLDFQVHAVLAQKSYLDRLHKQGLRTFFVVYDLLPLQLPKCFPRIAQEGHALWLQTICQHSGALCISRTVSSELGEWVRKNAPSRIPDFDITWFHLGADIDKSSPTRGLTSDAENVLEVLSGKPSFLMVGTLEPRKGHAQVLDGFECLWREGSDINLVIVGKQGWMMDAFVDRLRAHAEFNRHLFWLEGISDEYLEKLYEASTCLIAASHGEGFGLPLIEAAQHKIPIIAREIPVFCEVAGSHAFYFSGVNSGDLVFAIREWLRRHALSIHPKSDVMPWLTWKRSADILITRIVSLEIGSVDLKSQNKSYSNIS